MILRLKVVENLDFILLREILVSKKFLFFILTFQSALLFNKISPGNIETEKFNIMPLPVISFSLSFLFFSDCPKQTYSRFTYFLSHFLQFHTLSLIQAKTTPSLHFSYSKCSKRDKFENFIFRTRLTYSLGRHLSIVAFLLVFRSILSLQ